MVNSENYLLDTNVIIEVLRGNNDVISRIESVGQSCCYITEITIAELLHNTKHFVRIEGLKLTDWQ